MYLFEYEDTDPEILQSCKNRVEDHIVANAKIWKVKNVEFLYI